MEESQYRGPENLYKSVFIRMKDLSQKKQTGKECVSLGERLGDLGNIQWPLSYGILRRTLRNPELLCNITLMKAVDISTI